MNDRKLRVVKMSNQLFIEKGIQATSIQDILDYTGISKGTFYNYFSSKNELLIAIFKMTDAELEKKRNDLLIGQDPSNIEIFIKQVEMQIMRNRKKNLLPLYEEVMGSNDTDLKNIIERGRLKNISWLYHRFISIFGEDKKEYLLDCAIMFIGILRENIKFYYKDHHSNANIEHVLRYCVNRLINMVNELVESNEQLIEPQKLEDWLPECKKVDHELQKKLHHSVFILKTTVPQSEEQAKYVDLLDFIEEELLDSQNPRKFLIECALQSLKTINELVWYKELNQLEEYTVDFFNKFEIV